VSLILRPTPELLDDLPSLKVKMAINTKPLVAPGTLSTMNEITESQASCHVAILLCTYNGAEFLEHQLRSLASQSHSNWTIFASDDGSSDSTLSILQAFQNELGSQRLQIFQGPRRGFAKNFMSLVYHPAINADFYAFCDQDDEWFPDKLARALAALRKVPRETPALYCSRTKLVDSKLRPIGFSPLFKKPARFRNALVQSIAGANTMLINETTKRLLSQVHPQATVVAHDWLTYIIVSSCNGEVVYDPHPTLAYRQHDGNLIGANSSIGLRLRRIGQLLSGRFRIWTDQNLEALVPVRHLMAPSSQQAITYFETARISPLGRRLSMMKKAGIYRQTLFGNISLVLGAFTNKI
jgi:hypothetical protein